MIKGVKFLLPAVEINMGGFNVKQALPTQKVSQIDPFLLVHHAKSQYSDLLPARHQGIDPHPHRGFSPITIVIKGELRHRDSRGNDQVARPGEIQWMNAGAGIIHSERPTEELLRNGAYQEIIQIWINSPKAHKLDIPSYRLYKEENFRTEVSEDGLLTSKLLKHAEQPRIDLYMIKGQKEGSMKFAISEDHNSFLYIVNGSLRVKGYGKVDAEHLIAFEREGDEILISCLSSCEFLILSGKPIDEKIVQSGPYVMNTETEILEAIRDFQMGKMGILIEDY